MAKRNGLSAEPWWSPTPTLNSLVNPAALLTVVVAPSYIYNSLRPNTRVRIPSAYPKTTNVHFFVFQLEGAVYA